MRNTILLGSALILFGLVPVIAAGEKGSPKELADRSEPTLERVADAERALELAGFEHAFVYRWRGGLLDGHVLLDTPKGPRRVSLNTEKMARDARRVLASTSRKKDEAEGALAPTRFRGMVVIAIRPKLAGDKGHECVVGVSVAVGPTGKAAEVSSQPISGRVPENAGMLIGSRVCKLKLSGGGERELFELKLMNVKPPAK